MGIRMEYNFSSFITDRNRHLLIEEAPESAEEREIRKTIEKLKTINMAAQEHEAELIRLGKMADDTDDDRAKVFRYENGYDTVFSQTPKGDYIDVLQLEFKERIYGEMGARVLELSPQQKGLHSQPPGGVNV